MRFENASLSVRIVPLILRQEATVGTASIDGLAINLEVAADGSTNWDDLSGADDATPTPDDDTAAPMKIDVGNIRIAGASISYKDAQAGSTYAITDLGFESGGIVEGKRFKMEAQFDFAATPDDLAGNIAIRGRTTLTEGAAQVSIEDLNVAGEVTGLTSQPAVFNFDSRAMSIDTIAEQMSPGEMDLSILGVSLSAKVKPFSYAGNPQPEAELRVAEFSLKDLMRALDIEPPATADDSALSRVSFSAKAEVGQTALTMTAMTLELDDTKLTGQLSLPLTERGAYQFDFAADSINLDRYMAPADATGGDASAAAGDEIEIPVDLIRSLKANGSLKIDRAYLSGMTFENVVVAIDSANSRLRMHPISAELFGGTYNGDVRINAASDTPSISVNERISGVQLAPLALSMFEQDNITGTIEGNFKLSGSGRNLAAIRRDLRGTMAFSLADGTWEGTDVWYQLRSARALFKQEAPPEPRLPARTEFTAVRATGIVTGGVFSNDDLLAELPFLRLTGNGTVDLAEGQVDYSMQARVMEQPEFIDAANEAELADFSEAVIPLRISGPLASPSIRPDIEAMLRAEMKRAVEKHGEELKKRLIDELIGGGEQPASDQTGDEDADQAEPEQEKDPEDQLEDALKKLLGH